MGEVVTDYELLLELDSVHDLISSCAYDCKVYGVCLEADLSPAIDQLGKIMGAVANRGTPEDPIPPLRVVGKDD